MRQVSVAIGKAKIKILKMNGEPIPVEDLKIKVWNELDTNMEVPNFYRISLTGRKPPLVLSFKYKYSDTYLYMYGSFTVENPSQNNCDLVRRGRPKHVKVCPRDLVKGDAHTFGSMNYFYLKLQSNDKIEIMPEFRQWNRDKLEKAYTFLT